MSIRFIETSTFNIANKISRKNLKLKNFSGDFILLNDSLNKVFKSISGKGNSKQETTVGNQLLNITDGTYSNEGITAVVKDGEVTLNGTSTNISFITIPINIPLAESQYYTWGGNNAVANSKVGLKFSVGSTQINYNVLNEVNKTVTFQSSSEQTLDNIIIRVDANTTLSNFEFFPMFNVGQNSLPWEKYTCGASPNPSYEQPISSCGDNVNLFDVSTIIEEKIEDNGTTSSSTTMVSTDYIPIDVKKTYYKTITGSARVKLFDSNKSVISSSGWDISNFGNAQSFTIPTAFQNAKYIRFSIINEYVDTFKLEQGSTATPYSPYNQGVITENIVNKNLFDNTMIPNFQSSATAEAIETGVRTINNNSTGMHNLVRYNVMDLVGYKGKSITIKTNAKSSASNYAFLYLRIGDSNGNYGDYSAITSEKTLDGILTVTLNVPSTLDETYHYLWLALYATRDVIANIGDYVDYTNLQIEEGSTATDYVEHQKQNYSIYTQQPFRNIGDVRDIFIKKTDGNWYERHFFDRYHFTGQESNTTKSAATTNIIFQIRTFVDLIKKPATNNEVIRTLSNYFLGNLSANGVFAKDIIGIGITTTGTMNLGLGLSSSITTVAELNAFFQANDVYLDYPLETPTDLLCTEQQTEQLEAFIKARTYKNVTHIFSEDIVSPVIEGSYYVKC